MTKRCSSNYRKSLFSTRPLRYKRVYLSLCQVVVTPFHIQVLVYAELISVTCFSTIIFYQVKFKTKNRFNHLEMLTKSIINNSKPSAASLTIGLPDPPTSSFGFSRGRRPSLGWEDGVLPHLDQASIVYLFFTRATKEWLSLSY